MSELYYPARAENLEVSLPVSPCETYYVRHGQYDRPTGRLNRDGEDSIWGFVRHTLLPNLEEDAKHDNRQVAVHFKHSGIQRVKESAEYALQYLASMRHPDLHITGNISIMQDDLMDTTSPFEALIAQYTQATGNTDVASFIDAIRHDWLHSDANDLRSRGVIPAEDLGQSLRDDVLYADDLAAYENVRLVMVQFTHETLFEAVMRQFQHFGKTEGIRYAAYLRAQRFQDRTIITGNVTNSTSTTDMYGYAMLRQEPEYRRFPLLLNIH